MYLKIVIIRSKKFQNYNIDQKIRFDQGPFRNYFNNALKKLIKDNRAYVYYTEQEYSEIVVD